MGLGEEGAVPPVDLPAWRVAGEVHDAFEDAPCGYEGGEAEEAADGEGELDGRDLVSAEVEVVCSEGADDDAEYACDASASGWGVGAGLVLESLEEVLGLVERVLVGG